MTEPSKHLSMLRSYTAADALTIANASCGTISIFLCLDYVETGSNRYIWIAFLLLPMALVFDILDGWVARAQPNRKSVLGGDLDSLADVISFGVAPAVLGFTLGMRGAWDMVCLTYFVVCGVSPSPPASRSSRCWRRRWNSAASARICGSARGGWDPPRCTRWCFCTSRAAAR